MQVKLIGVYPPLEKMDNSVGLLAACEKLSLSTNMITQSVGWRSIIISFLGYRTYRI